MVRTRSSCPSSIPERIIAPAANDGFEPDYLYNPEGWVSLLRESVQAEGWQFLGCYVDGRRRRVMMLRRPFARRLS